MMASIPGMKKGRKREREKKERKDSEESHYGFSCGPFRHGEEHFLICLKIIAAVIILLMLS